MLAMLFGSTMSGGNTISTQLRSTSPDGVWATRVKRGGMLLGSQSDTVIVRPERDYLSVCMIRVARAPIRSVTKLSWEGRTLVVTTTEPFTVPLAPVSGVTILCRKP